jgi:hypothetical protein
MSRAIALAVCLLAACATLGAAADLPAAARCSDNTGTTMAGGWSTVSDVPADVYSAIQMAVVENNTTAGLNNFCDDPTPSNVAACSQASAAA